MVLDGDEEVTEEEGVSSDWLEEKEEAGGVSGSLSLVAVALLLVASGFRETPSSCWISSGFRPLDSRKETLRSVGASRIDSSSRNLEACSTRSCLEVDAGASSELSDEAKGDCSVGADPDRCHEGIEGGLDEGSDMVLVSGPVQSQDKSERWGEEEGGTSPDFGWHWVHVSRPRLLHRFGLPRSFIIHQRPSSLD